MLHHWAGMHQTQCAQAQREHSTGWALSSTDPSGGGDPPPAADNAADGQLPPADIAAVQAVKD